MRVLFVALSLVLLFAAAPQTAPPGSTQAVDNGAAQAHAQVASGDVSTNVLSGLSSLTGLVDAADNGVPAEAGRKTEVTDAVTGLSPTGLIDSVAELGFNLSSFTTNRATTDGRNTVIAVSKEVSPAALTRTVGLTENGVNGDKTATNGGHRARDWVLRGPNAT